MSAPWAYLLQELRSPRPPADRPCFLFHERLFQSRRHLGLNLVKGSLYAESRGVRVPSAVEQTRDARYVNPALGTEARLVLVISNLPEEHPDLHALYRPRVVHEAVRHVFASAR